MKNGAMCVSSEEPPFSSEMWLIPAAEVMRPALFAGKHRVFDEKGAYAFDISLFENGTARKSHAPKTAGLWLGRKDLILVVWTNGFRDMLTRDKAGFRKTAISPGISLYK